jgi:microcystin-dependent protein
MNIINFTLLNGLPMNQMVLGRLQTAFSLFNALGAIAGDKTIISGCVVTGSNVSDGVVFVNGEVFEFKGGVIQPKVIVLETVTNLTFKNDNSYPVVKTRQIAFGSGVGQMDWVDFQRPIETKSIPTDLVTRLENLEKKSAVFQAGGGMVLWNKPAINIPAGWAEVVNWRGRIPVGMDVTQTEFNTLGKQGGAKSKILSEAEMPEHGHKMFTNEDRPGSPSSSANRLATENPDNYVAARCSDGGDNDYSLTKASTGLTPSAGNSGTSGSGQSFSILNPYRTVLFIEYIL